MPLENDLANYSEVILYLLFSNTPFPFAKEGNRKISTLVWKQLFDQKI